MNPFDIYYAAHFWRNDAKQRPWLLVRRIGKYWLCFAISSRDYDSGPYEVASNHPDFPATGLDHTSYIYDSESFHQIAVADLGRRLGCLAGALLEDFKKQTGVTG